MKNLFFLLGLCLIGSALPGQNWQQRADYRIEVALFPESHRLEGRQTISYYNASPDTLKQLFLHLYFNAFQPGSMMDVRSRTIPDPDSRVGDRIQGLAEDEIGFHQIERLLVNGVEQSFAAEQTLLQVPLQEALAPGSTSEIYLEYRSQVPVQIRRSGRNNAEGVDYTMTQWFPKIAAYDQNGWHPNPYVGREFYGPFGDYEVSITLPSSYKIGGTGLLQEEEQYWQAGDSLAHGALRYRYRAAADARRTWHFKARQVHTFAWAADPDFIHLAQQQAGKPDLHFYYLPAYDSVWRQLIRPARQFFDITSATFGAYPYPQFSAVQGGDGGMEYPMCTMLKGTGKLPGLLGTLAHEAAHNWYYGVLASDEFRYPWMDEGFTSFAESYGLNQMRREPVQNPHQRMVAAAALMTGLNPKFEPLSTPADYFEHNRTYSFSAYVRGEAFLAQLQYILGDSLFFEGMRHYWLQYQFRHPTPQDFMRVMERRCGMQLDWYLHQWWATNHHIDYRIDTLVKAGAEETRLSLRRVGSMPMPCRLQILLKSGDTLHYYIPLVSMFGHPQERGYRYAEPWPWTHPEYSLIIPVKKRRIEKVYLDRHGYTAEVNRRDNEYPYLEEEVTNEDKESK